MIDNLANNFHGYAVLLRKIKQRVLIAQQRAIYAANEEMLRMYWDVGIFFFNSFTKLLLLFGCASKTYDYC